MSIENNYSTTAFIQNGERDIVLEEEDGRIYIAGRLSSWAPFENSGLIEIFDNGILEIKKYDDTSISIPIIENTLGTIIVRDNGQLKAGTGDNNIGLFINSPWARWWGNLGPQVRGNNTVDGKKDVGGGGG